jgi:hypothetical protein
MIVSVVEAQPPDEPPVEALGRCAEVAERSTRAACFAAAAAAAAAVVVVVVVVVVGSADDDDAAADDDASCAPAIDLSTADWRKTTSDERFAAGDPSSRVTSTPLGLGCSNAAWGGWLDTFARALARYCGGTGSVLTPAPATRVTPLLSTHALAGKTMAFVRPCFPAATVRTSTLRTCHRSWSPSSRCSSGCCDASLTAMHSGRQRVRVHMRECVRFGMSAHRVSNGM